MQFISSSLKCLQSESSYASFINSKNLNVNFRMRKTEPYGVSRYLCFLIYNLLLKSKKYPWQRMKMCIHVKSLQQMFLCPSCNKSSLEIGTTMLGYSQPIKVSQNKVVLISCNMQPIPFISFFFLKLEVMVKLWHKFLHLIYSKCPSALLFISVGAISSCGLCLVSPPQAVSCDLCSTVHVNHIQAKF